MIHMATQGDKYLKIHRSHRADRPVPELRLMGLWLERLGFAIGVRVQITMRDKLLIIELLEGEAKEAANYKEALAEVKSQLKKLSQWKSQNSSAA